VADHDGRVVWRKTARVPAHRLGDALDLAAEAARAAGFAAVTVACEPTGPRWMQVQRLCAARGLGRRREQLVTAATAAVLRIRDFLSVAWPSAVTAAVHPFDSVTWLACLQVVTQRCGADPGRLAAIGGEEFCALAAADDPDAVGWSRRGLFRRIAAELGDLQRARAQLRAVEADMAGVLAGELGLSRLGGIPGLTLTGAAVILAEAGGPRRYDTSKSLVKHAGLSPADQSSGAFEGQSHISRRGRPRLRTAAWRMIFPLLRHNPVMAAKYQAMVAAAEQGAAQAAARARPGSARAAQAARAVRSARARARGACAASLLRWIYFLTVHGADWDPVAASGGHLAPPEPAAAA